MTDQKPGAQLAQHAPYTVREVTTWDHAARYWIRGPSPVTACEVVTAHGTRLRVERIDGADVSVAFYEGTTRFASYHAAEIMHAHAKGGGLCVDLKIPAWNVDARALACVVRCLLAAEGQ